MSQILLLCSHCEEEFFFQKFSCIYWTSSNHTTPSMEQLETIYLITTPIWCHVCNQPSYAERVPSLREFEKAIAVAARGEAKGIYIHVDDDLVRYSLENLRFLAQHLNLDRKGACLCCGGYQYTKLYDDYNNLIKLKHQFCEGYLRKRIRIFSVFFSRYTTRWYDMNGKFLLEKSTSTPHPPYL